MKRVILSLTAVALFAFGSLICGNAQAQSPHRVYRGQVTAPAVVIYSGGGGYYGNGYGGGYGGGYAPYAGQTYFPRAAPYGAGYSSGYQPYQEMYLQRLYYGLGF